LDALVQNAVLVHDVASAGSLGGSVLVDKAVDFWIEFLVAIIDALVGLAIRE